jgi:hypothetical protein
LRRLIPELREEFARAERADNVVRLDALFQGGVLFDLVLDYEVSYLWWWPLTPNSSAGRRICRRSRGMSQRARDGRAQRFGDQRGQSRHWSGPEARVLHKAEVLVGGEEAPKSKPLYTSRPTSTSSALRRCTRCIAVVGTPRT